MGDGPGGVDVGPAGVGVGVGVAPGGVGVGVGSLVSTVKKCWSVPELPGSSVALHFLKCCRVPL